MEKSPRVYRTEKSFCWLIVVMCSVIVTPVKGQSYVWAKTLPGAAVLNSYSNDIQADNAGNCIVVGKFYNTIDFDPGPGTTTATALGSSTVVTYLSDAFVAKYNSNGNYVWAFQIGSVGNDQINSVDTDINGNVFVAGVSTGTVDFDPGPGTATLAAVGSNSLMFFAKYDAGGNFMFVKGLTTVSGGINQLSLDPGGNILVTGTFSGTADFDPSLATFSFAATQADLFVAKYNASGTLLWAYGLGGTNSDFGFGVGADASGNVYIGGYYGATVNLDPTNTNPPVVSNGGTDLFIAKFNSSGAHQWSKSVGSTLNEMLYGFDVDPTGNIYITGVFYGSFDSDPGSGVATLTNLGNADIFAAKYTNAGNYVWANSIGSSSLDVGRAMEADGSGNCYVTGYLNGVADFDPGIGTYTLATNGLPSTFLIKYNPTGGFSDAFVVTSNTVSGISTVGNYAFGISTDQNNYVFISGFLVNNADFDPGTAVATQTTNGNSEQAHFAKYNGCGVKLSSSASQVCSGTPVTLSTTATGNILWSTGANTSSISVTPTANTSYTVSGSALNGNTTCTTSVAISVSVNLPPTLIATVTPSAICIGNTGSISVSGAATYSWSTGATTSVITITPAVTGIYTVTGISSASCTISQTILVPVNAIPFVTAVSNRTMLCYNESVVLTGSGANTYSWSNGNTNQTFTLTPPSPGIIIYTLTGTDANGCSNTATISLNVSNCTSLSSISTAARVSIFPNPTNGKVRLEFGESVTGIALLYDSAGKLLREEDVNNSFIEVDLTTNPLGIYLIRIHERESSKVFRVVKE